MMTTRVLILTDNIQISTKEMKNCAVRKHIKNICEMFSQDMY